MNLSMRIFYPHLGSLGKSIVSINNKTTSFYLQILISSLLVSTDFAPITPRRQPVISPELQTSLEKTFNSRRQYWQILWKGFVIWLRTVALLVLLAIILVVYNQKPVMSSGEANTFNSLVTALSITLGLNIASALKEMTLDMRWYFLSRTARPLSEVQFLFQIIS
jgi:hypothetical protein